MILDDIVAATKKRLAIARDEAPYHAVRDRACAAAASGATGAFIPAFSKIRAIFTQGATDGTDPPGPSFMEALAAPGISFICEVKKASPSKGVIAEDFPYLNIAKEYVAAGAAAISVLTEPDFFRGSNDYLCEIAKAVSVPVLRKDFIIDDYQIYEAKNLGAAAILLIGALLDDKTLRLFLDTAHTLKLDALVEAHDGDELHKALDSGADIIGVNNRDLKTFTVDISNSVRLRALVPPEKIFVAESGIRTPEDIKILRDARVDAVLIGEAVMRQTD
jgi:indole-3-glycerol phosphate synthase